MKVLFYSNNCQYCVEIIKKINESSMKELIKMVCIDTNPFDNIKTVPTIIDSDYKEILEGKKAFDYIKNKDFFNFSTNNVLCWKEKEVPDPKIENDKLAIDNSISINENLNEIDNNSIVESVKELVKEPVKELVKEPIKKIKLNRNTSLLLRRR